MRRLLFSAVHLVETWSAARGEEDTGETTPGQDESIPPPASGDSRILAVGEIRRTSPRSNLVCFSGKSGADQGWRRNLGVVSGDALVVEAGEAFLGLDSVPDPAGVGGGHPG